MTHVPGENIGGFDYVIVGAGSAGCVLANRLSADPKAKVLLLEAGGRDSNPWIHIPAGFLYTRNRPGTDWCFRTEPEPELGGRTLPLPLGRVLGGCSSINGMVYVRGHAQDYDLWRQSGNDGWGWDDVLPYFKRSENFDGAAGDSHGVGGEWNVETKDFDWPILRAVISAGADLGLPHLRDPNEGDNHGLWFAQVNQRRGRRSSTATAFLLPARRRPNLSVQTQAVAKRIRFEGVRATGVEFESKGALKFAGAREVILAAGAINSPLLLQRSGVGPAAVLKEHGIAVIHDLAGVGDNLQDHLQLRTVFRVSNVRTMNEQARSAAARLRMGIEYAIWRRGPLTYAPSQLIGFARTDATKATPDLQMLFQLGSVDSSGRFDAFPAITVALCNMRPQSRGRVRIRSADVRDPPIIQPNYLSAAADREAVIPAVRLIRGLMARPALEPYAPQEIAPGPHVQSDEEIRSCAAEIASSLFHPVGTCAMGAGANAVVDSRLRVRGLSGVRVVDASVMPAIVSGNTNAPTVMIAEKGADMIRQDGVPH